MLSLRKVKNVFICKRHQENISNNDVSICGNLQSLFIDVWIEVIAKMICQIHLLYLEECFIQEEQEKNFRNLC